MIQFNQIRVTKPRSIKFYWVNETSNTLIFFYPQLVNYRCTSTPCLHGNPTEPKTDFIVNKMPLKM